MCQSCLQKIVFRVHAAYFVMAMGALGGLLLLLADKQVRVFMDLQDSKNLLELHRPKCAIAFYGLPRAFKSLVLPSIVKNVIIPNEKYRCDFFVHYHKLDREVSGRSGSGGELHVQDILLLKEEVENRGSSIQFSHTVDADFWHQYSPLLDKINNTYDEDGHPLYFPWKSPSYEKPATTNNIIKMWHSIEQAWHLTAQTNVTYNRVAMMRSDVFYLTSVDVFEYPKQAVVPGFARYPVSDRMVIGPLAAVKIWASERFSRMEKHVQYVLKTNPGYGLHSESFVDWTLFPAMRDALNAPDAIMEHPSLCFFRVRADESVWISDCTRGIRMTRKIGNFLYRRTQSKTVALVEDVLGRKCSGPAVLMPKLQKYQPKVVVSLNCSQEHRTDV